MKLYIPYDTIGKQFLFNFSSCFDNDAAAVRSIIFPLTREYPLKDITLHSFSFDESKYSDVPWSAYKIPETKAESLAPLGSDINKVLEAYNEKNKEIFNKEDTLDV